MARIKQGNTFLAQQQLLQNIIARHNHDGAGSVLTIYLERQEIDLAVVAAQAAEAKIHETDRQTYSAKKETLRAARDLQFLPVFKNMKAAVQYLKKLNASNVKALADWGIVTKASGSVKYPISFLPRLEMFFTFYQKYKELPAANSPLAPFLTQNNIDLDAVNAKAETAKQAHTAFALFARKAEAETEARKAKWKPIVKNMRGIGQFLSTLFVSNQNALAGWGFTVVTTTNPPKLQKSKLKAGQKLHIKGAVLGSVLTNLSQTELRIYKGTQKNNPPVIVLPNQTMEVTKGFSQMMVENQSLQQTAFFTLQINR